MLGRWAGALLSVPRVACTPVLAGPGRSTVRAFSGSSEGSSSTAAAPGHGQQTMPPSIIVFGGRGFVGSNICHQALETGLRVVACSPSGTSPTKSEPWTRAVEWVRGSALEPQTYRHLLPGAMAVISCIGAFGSQQHMMRINGTANVSLIEEAKAAGIPRFVYISAHIPNIPGIGTLLQGYVEGKAASEAALAKEFPQTGVALRPGAIYGPRSVSTSMTLPLQYLFQPVEAALGMMGTQTSQQLSKVPLVGAAFVPPVSVAAVAKVAVRAATDPSVAGGILDPWDIQRLAR